MNSKMGMQVLDRLAVERTQAVSDLFVGDLFEGIHGSAGRQYDAYAVSAQEFQYGACLFCQCAGMIQQGAVQIKNSSAKVFHTHKFNGFR